MATSRLSFKHLLSFVFLAFFLSACNGDKAAENESSGISEATSEQIQDVRIDDDVSVAEVDKEENLNQSAFSWLKLSGWHTKGTISRDTPIRIIFNREIVEKESVGKDASAVMHIFPEIQGNPIFKSQSEIVWKPTESLQDGLEYKVSIKAKGLKEVPVSAQPYQFSFQVIPLEFEVKTLGLKALDNKNKMSLSGQLLTSDRVASEQVEKTLKASLQGKTLPINWSHNSAGRKHTFTIDTISRETFTTNVLLNWDGQAINIKKKGKLEVSIPAINEFKITSMRVVHDSSSNPYVQVRFSDQLDDSQNTKGLIQLARNKYKVSINGNVASIYPNKNLSGSFKVNVNAGIKSKSGKVLSENIEQNVAFDAIKPQVRFAGNGSILPKNDRLEIPFEAVGINAIEVTALEVFPDNMGQFLQSNQISGGSSVERTGRYLWRKTIPLTPADPNKWNRYSFNVTDLMENHHAGLLRLTLTIRKKHSTYECSSKQTLGKSRRETLRNMEDNGVYEAVDKEAIVTNDISDEDRYYDYDWENRNDPCFNAYFGYYNRSKTKISQNFIASNIGLIAKQDAMGNLRIISTDLRTAEPLTGVDIEVKNFQGQVLATAKSDGDGFAKVELTATPFVVVAKKFNDTAYLKVNAKTALSVSHFNVSGKKVSKGLKGIIYGERGVWRPGDNIFLTFVVQDKADKIPQGHPVTMKLIDPRGRVVASKTSTHSVGGFYAFKLKTKEKAMTGNYIAKAYLGGSTFTKSIMIETIRPNRLKIDLTFENDKDEVETVIYSSDGKAQGKLFSQWLHGATASDLKADISLRFSKMKTRFAEYSNYSFDDPARTLKSEDSLLLKGQLDKDGYLRFQKNIKPQSLAPGMLKARFTSRVFEKGGAFSISRNSFDYHPYENYVGLQLPKSQASYDLLYTDKTHTIQIASVTAKGEPVSLDRVKVSLYKIGWRWWWDSSRNSLAEFAEGKHTDLLKNTVINTVDGKAEWDFSVPQAEWGRYLVRVCDLEGDHCAGKMVYIDWPDWSGRAQKAGSAAASRLSLSSDKDAYTVDETAIIQLPATSKGRALMTIETGSQILEQRWISLDPIKSTDGKNKIQVEVPITQEMSPNAYVHITLIQPHKDKNNDRPIRLYGIIPLEVADPSTYLKPILEVDEEWKPESKQKVKVSESSGKAMNYTIAVVDEGLLGLTAFKTPNLHRYFYSKEALGIKTWDLFDAVIGAYGGKLERMLALGGGDADEVDNEDSKKRRFPPVVRFIGPYTLEAGATAEHEIELPPYLGAVRVMLVAGEKGAYGKAQSSVFVRQPLMIQASLPRTLGPDEEVAVPVTLFAMDDSIKEVTLTVETDDLVNIVGDAKSTVTFSKMGDQLAFIKLRTANRIGKTHIHFAAKAITDKGEQISESDVYLDIHRPNDETSRSLTQLIEPGDSWLQKSQAFGLEGTNEAVVEISSLPPLNLDKRLNYLIRYPHGCLEQTTSSVFPQLFLSNVTSLDKKKQEKSESNIKKGIERLRSFQQGSGNFTYWPGGSYNNDWASIYAGHFLVEAEKEGYLMPANLLTDWLNFQIDEAQNYIVGNLKYSHTQAYRLYVLAIAGKPQMGAMNRLREHTRLNNKARWLLASAYYRASQPEAARSIIEGLLPQVDPVTSSKTSDITFGSTLGDLGLQLEALVTLNKKQNANTILEQIAEQMRGDRYQSTQGIAWALMAVSRYLGGDTSHFTATLSQDGIDEDINSDKPISRVSLKKPNTKIDLKNTSGIKLFATLVNRGVPSAGEEKNFQEGISLEVDYEVRDKENSKLWHPVEDHMIPQGSDVRISVTVQNDRNYRTKNIALTIPVAAGMEILSASEQQGIKAKYDYRDLRDDRIHYYFSLRRNKPKTFTLLMNAAYKGRYYMPAVNVEAMYDGDMKARQKGQVITIFDSKEKQSNIGQKLTITSKKAYLYELADETTRTKMFAIKGDQVLVLKEESSEDNSRWLYIRYEGASPIEKWIRADTTL